MMMKANHYLGLVSLALFLLSSVVTRCSTLENGPLLLRRAGEANSVDSDTLLYVAPECDDTGMSCVWECPWIVDDDFQWCGHCGYFLRCRNGQPHLIRCPRERQLWDNIAKKCQDHTLTCLCTRNDDHTTSEPIATTATPMPGTTKTPKSSTSGTGTRRARISGTRRLKTGTRKRNTAPAQNTLMSTSEEMTIGTEATSFQPTIEGTSSVPEASTQNPASTENTETPEPMTTASQPTTIEIPTITSSEIPDTAETEVTETQGPTIDTETQGPTTVATDTQGPSIDTETQVPTTVATDTQGPTTVSKETQGPTTVDTDTQGPTTVTETQGPTIVTETQGSTTVATATQGQTTVATATQGQTTVATATQGSTTVATATQGQTTVATATQGQTTVATATQGQTTVATATQGQTTVATETQGPTIVTETHGPTTATNTGGPTIVTVTQEPTINGTIGPTITVTQGPTINGTIEPTINGTIGPNTTVTQGPTINGTIEPTINGTIGPTITVTQGPTINGTTTETTGNTTETFSPTSNETSSNETETTVPFSTANFTNASTSTPPTTQNPADRDEYIEGTVYLNPYSGAVTYKLGKMDKKKGTVYGFYNNTIHRTGWGVLEIKANPRCKEDRAMPPFNVAGKMYAAGFLEGLLTARQIWEHYLNMESQMYSWNATLNAAVKEFVELQDNWTRAMIDIQRHRRDPYWMNVEYVVNQLDGLHAGYKVIAKAQGWDTGFHVVQMINLLGDLGDLQSALSRQSSPLDRSPFNIGGRCSALIKLTPGFENIFIGHSTWFVYASTLRIYKHYRFPFLRFTTGSIGSSFSSYPGNLGSLDDFYLTDAGLGVMETTNSIFNTELYKEVIPESLFTWQRAIIANRMARTGKTWFYIFRLFNSGTYNNQFMIIDFKRISLNEVVEDDALWIIEQIPGLVKGGDQTSILRAGYWPSYNIPFYEEIYEKSGYGKMVALWGSRLSYQLAPRAKIFRRDAGRITNITSFMDLLRYNDYLNDEYSEGNPGNAICSRYDLASRYGSAFGCYDTKVADYNMSRALTSVVLSGPTTSHGLKPFSWRGKWQNESHIGLPDTYDFSWIPMFPSLT